MHQFTIVEKIGAGTFGEVYKAQNAAGQIFALKMFRHKADDEELPSTALREICLLKALRHPNIVELHDVLHEAGKHTLVLEYLDQDLDDLLRRDGALDAGTTKSFLHQLLAGVVCCHERKILHRDLKPQNLLISGGRHLKLADFGLARAFGTCGQSYTGVVVTLWYRAPEVLMATGIYFTPVDIWSVGVIFAEMVNGTPLIRGRAELEQMYKIFECLAKPWSNVVPTLDPEGVELLARMLICWPDQRISGKDAMGHEFLKEAQMT
mmetsp:Transcript_111587/g.322533  ORF Transcript_111587/g.322533 Transcript_111587/m.322533 type:complete len:265 (+) Transcript_111587:131-925(+)